MATTIFYQGKRSERLDNVKEKLIIEQEKVRLVKERLRNEREMRKTSGSNSLFNALKRLSGKNKRNK